MAIKAVVFNEVVHETYKLLLKTKKLNERDISELLNDIKLKINALKAHSDEKRFLIGLFSNKDMEPVVTDLYLLKSCFQIFYDLLCEFIGPVDTDRIVSAALRSVSEMDVALEFDPKELFS